MSGRRVPLASMGRRFYDGSPGRGLVPCSDCGSPADELFGDHHGMCLVASSPGGDRRPVSEGEGGTAGV